MAKVIFSSGTIKINHISNHYKVDLGKLGWVVGCLVPWVARLIKFKDQEYNMTVKIKQGKGSYRAST